jgi:protein SCO1/2
MDHSRSAYLMDRMGKPLALLPVEESGDAVAAEIEQWAS